MKNIILYLSCSLFCSSLFGIQNHAEKNIAHLKALLLETPALMGKATAQKSSPQQLLVNYLVDGKGLAFDRSLSPTERLLSLMPRSVHAASQGPATDIKDREKVVSLLFSLHHNLLIEHVKDAPSSDQHALFAACNALMRHPSYSKHFKEVFPHIISHLLALHRSGIASSEWVKELQVLMKRAGTLLYKAPHTVHDVPVTNITTFIQTLTYVWQKIRPKGFLARHGKTALKIAAGVSLAALAAYLFKHKGAVKHDLSLLSRVFKNEDVRLGDLTGPWKGWGNSRFAFNPLVYLSDGTRRAEEQAALKKATRKELQILTQTPPPTAQPGPTIAHAKQAYEAAVHTASGAALLDPKGHFNEAALAHVSEALQGKSDYVQAQADSPLREAQQRVAQAHALLSKKLTEQRNVAGVFYKEMMPANATTEAYKRVQGEVKKARTEYQKASTDLEKQQMASDALSSQARQLKKRQAYQTNLLKKDAAYFTQEHKRLEKAALDLHREVASARKAIRRLAREASARGSSGRQPEAIQADRERYDAIINKHTVALQALADQSERVRKGHEAYLHGFANVLMSEATDAQRVQQRTDLARARDAYKAYEPATVQALTKARSARLGVGEQLATTAKSHLRRILPRTRQSGNPFADAVEKAQQHLADAQEKAADAHEKVRDAFPSQEAQDAFLWRKGVEQARNTALKASQQAYALEKEAQKSYETWSTSFSPADLAAYRDAERRAKQALNIAHDVHNTAHKLAHEAEQTVGTGITGIPTRFLNWAASFTQSEPHMLKAMLDARTRELAERSDAAFARLQSRVVPAAPPHAVQPPRVAPVAGAGAGAGAGEGVAPVPAAAPAIATATRPAPLPVAPPIADDGDDDGDPDEGGIGVGHDPARAILTGDSLPPRTA